MTLEAVGTASPRGSTGDSVSDLQELWPVGLAIVFFGSLAGAAGDTMVRRAYSRKGPGARSRDVMKSKMFIVGMILTTFVDAGCTLLALVFSPSCMVTPFAGVHIFWSVLFSRFWLHERVGKWQLTGASGVISGVVLLVLFAGHGPSAEDFAEESVPLVDVYVALASEPLAVGYFAASASVVTVLLVLSLDLYPAKLQGWGTAVRRLATALASGVFGGNTNVAAKFFTVALAQLLSGDSSMRWRLELYFALFATVALALLQLVFLNTALRRYDAIYVIPTTNSCLVASGIFGAICVLREIPESWAGFVGGLILCVGGILILTITHEHVPLKDAEVGDRLGTSSLSSFSEVRR